MSHHRLLIVLTAIGALALPGSALSASPEGLWLVKDQTGRIRIEKCGGRMWGTIAWQRTPKTDANNPNPALQRRSLLGAAILIGMKQVAPDRWDGDIYNPQNGKIYNSNITLLPSGMLQIKGCVLGGLICGGEDWTRLAETTPGTAPKNNCAAARAGH
jgi:uncharacterized protein (DUF2147 family)